MNMYWFKEKAQDMQAASSADVCTCGLITGDYLCWFLWSGGGTGKNRAGATQTDSVTTAETQPCSFVFVHKACLWAKTSVVIFAFGLLVLRGQIFLLEGTLQTLTLTVEWITEESTHKGLNNADTAANAGSRILDYFTIIHGRCCLFLSHFSVESQ